MTGRRRREWKKASGCCTYAVHKIKRQVKCISNQWLIVELSAWHLCRLHTNRQHPIGYSPPEVTIPPLSVLDPLCTDKVRSTTCSPASMLRLQFPSTAVNVAAICARPECMCYPIAILQHQSKFTSCQEKESGGSGPEYHSLHLLRL